MADPYPPDPKHQSAKEDSSLYPDGSGFHFDLPPRYVLNDWTETRQGGVYEVPFLPKPNPDGSYMGWTSWIDKFQKDYRFAHMSDYNARAQVFAEVRDPWMFTEYVYQGKGTDNDQDGSPSRDTGIVEPPLVNPLVVNRVFEGSGNQLVLKSSEIQYLNSQPVTVLTDQPQVQYQIENKWKSKATGKFFWQSELEAASWIEAVDEYITNRDFERTDIQRRVVAYAASRPNGNVRVYPHAVWANATRWGESQNVPERTVNMTAPKTFIRPDARLTGRLIPRVTIEWGIPIYDVLADGHQQASVRYDGYAYSTGNILLFPRTVSGPDGVPDGEFSYDVSPAAPDTTGALKCQMPSSTQASPIIWNAANKQDGDLVHRGCQFWEGHGGKARCTYYQNFISQFSPSWEQSSTYTDPTLVVTSFTVPPFVGSTEEYQVYVTLGSTKKTLQDFGVTFTLQDTQLVLSRPVTPVSDLGGSGVVVRLVRVKVTRPVPSGTLCGSYTNKDGKLASGIADAKVGYTAAGGKCPFYSPLGPMVLGSYTVKASNGAEWANLQRGLPSNYKQDPKTTGAGQAMIGIGFAGGTAGAGVGASLGLAYANSIPTPDPFTNGLHTEEYNRTTITFAPETITIGGKSTYYATKSGKPSQKDPENDIRVDPTTSFRTLDWIEESPVTGVDSLFFGLVNQINFRVLRNVQHCYRPEKCDSIISSPSGNVGWSRGRYSGVDFRNHPLRMPGYPAADGTDKHCHVGNFRCPYNQIDRRAYEYDQNYRVLLTEILGRFRVSGLAGFPLTEAVIHPDGTVSIIGGTDEDAWFNGGDIQQKMFCAVSEQTNSGPVIGHWQPLVRERGSDRKLRLYFYYEFPSFDPRHRYGRVAAHIVQFDDTDQAVYMPSNTSTQAFFGGNAPWLVELLDDYVSPTGNATLVTNNLPTAGGRHPEYKDHSLRDRQVMSNKGGYSDRSFREGGTDTNQFGGPLWNRAPVTGVAKVGYWVEADGRWILDGRKIPSGPYVEPLPRMKNKPPVVNGCYPVDGWPGVTIQDPTDPKFSRSGDWASVGTAYSNDTKKSIKWIQDVWSSYLPKDPNADDPDAKIPIAPPQPNLEMLPRERIWFRCDNCGIDFPEEEVNQMLSMKNVNGDPLYPPPSGWQSRPTASGMMRACGCPRYDNGLVYQVGSYDRFMNTYSRGSIDVWAPPGTSVDRKGFFWKNPTMVNRLHEHHLLRKLGTYNDNPAGGGYTYKQLSKGVELFGRLPETTARGDDAGIARQIVRPFASQGDTIRQVRDRLKDAYLLTPDDFPVIQNPEGLLFRVTPDAEANRRLMSGEILRFYRGEGMLSYVVGLPIPVRQATNNGITDEPEVTLSINQDAPKRDDYPPGGHGDKMFNAALRQYLISALSNTLQNYSSSLFANPNAMSDQLKARGLDPTLAAPLDPNTGQLIPFDESVISPYTSGEAGGLKMVTMTSLKRLRNRVLPMMAYDLNAKTYTAGGDFTDRAQAGNTNRFAETRRPQPSPTFGTIEPQVLAATSTGRDYFTEWETGDIEGTKARAYYPVGTTWWRMNQVVGQIRRNGGRNRLHLDQGDKNADGSFKFPEYTGDTITSTVTYFIHGRIPMDKEVVRAFLIFTPNDPPSMDAIGCQGQYTGFAGTRNFYDPTQIDGLVYVGGRYCFWQHYHGFTTNHEADHKYNLGNFTIDGGSLGVDGRFGGSGFGGLKSKLHAEAHDPNFIGADNPAIPTLLTDPPPRNTGPGPNYISEHRPWLDGDPATLYEPMVKILAQSFADQKLGWTFSDYPQPPFTMNSEDGQFVWGQKVKHLTTENETWRAMSTSLYNSVLDRYTVQATAAVNTRESVLSLTYVGGEFRGNIFPLEAQPVSNWINWRGYDNSGRFDFSLTPLATPTLLADSTGVSSILGGGGGTTQAGTVEKVMNITDTVRKLYNDRVDRYFKCQLGKKLSELYDFVKSTTDTNEGDHPDYHDGYNEPRHWWNYRYMKSGVGMWLSDPWHHTPLSNDVPATGNDDGDPIVQSQSDRDARISYVSGWDTNNYPSSRSESKNHHPINLLASSLTTFDETSPPTSRPTPVDPVPGKDWTLTDTTPTAQWFEVDLRSTPYENEHRNWRYQAPTIDATNATCPNPGCFVHQNGWTVGQFYQQSQGTWGYGIIPSIHSDICASCSTKLQGVVYSQGDGVETSFYETPFVQDVLISALEVTIGSTKHGFTIEYYNSNSGAWRTLFQVDVIAGSYYVTSWNGSAWQKQQVSALPSIFRGVEGVAGTPRDPSGSIGAHFCVVSGSKVRMKVNRPGALTVITTTSVSSPTTSRDGFTIQALDLRPEQYVGMSIDVQYTAPTGTSILNTTIASVDTAGTTGDGRPANYIIKLADSWPTGATPNTCNITFKGYRCNCTRFRVYGYPYAEGDVVITPPGFVQSMPLFEGQSTFRLPTRPSQIIRMNFHVGEDEEVAGTEKDDDKSLHWIVQKVSDGTYNYLRIVGCEWYYDYSTNTIKLPTTYQDPDTGKEVGIWTLNSTITPALPYKTLPTSVTAEYIFGSGVSTTVNITPFGPGPSYQLDRECVCYILGENDSGASPTEKIGHYDSMPPMGKSVRLAGRGGSRIDMKWQVYNHDPITWQPNNFWLIGDELPKAGWSDRQVLDLFTGNHGDNVSDLGPGAVLGGNATGKVTLYGAPGTILSGDVWVYAKAVTERTYNLPDGSKVVTRERTGGYRSGAFVFRLEVNGSVSNKRTGITTSVPRVLVYLRERGLDEPV